MYTPWDENRLYIQIGKGVRYLEYIYNTRSQKYAFTFHGNNMV